MYGWNFKPKIFTDINNARKLIYSPNNGNLGDSCALMYALIGKPVILGIDHTYFKAQ